MWWQTVANAIDADGNSLVAVERMECLVAIHSPYVLDQFRMNGHSVENS